MLPLQRGTTCGDDAVWGSLPLAHIKVASKNYSLQFQQSEAEENYEKKSVNHFIFIECSGVGFL